MNKLLKLFLALLCLLPLGCRNDRIDNTIEQSLSAYTSLKPEEAYGAYEGYKTPGLTIAQIPSSTIPYWNQPNWEQAQTVSVPGTNIQLVRVPAGKYHKGLGHLSLLFTRKHGKVESIVVGVSPESDYQKSNTGKTGWFSGDIYLYSQDGRFLRGIRYKVGLIKAILRPKGQNSISTPKARRYSLGGGGDDEEHEGGSLPDVEITPIEFEVASDGGMTLNWLFSYNGDTGWSGPEVPIGGGNYNPQDQPHPNIIRDPILEEDICKGLTKIWSLSFDPRTREVWRENSAWITSKGLVIMNNQGNTATSSQTLNDRIVLTNQNGTNYLRIFGENDEMVVFGRIHTHPSGNTEPSTDDLKNTFDNPKLVGIPSFIFTESGLYQIARDTSTPLGVITSTQVANFEQACNNLMQR